MEAPWSRASLPVASRTPEPHDLRAPIARGSRKFAVSLFADLTGYTALCERLDPEDVERAVLPLMTEMRLAVEAEGGVVLNIAGDGLFAIFGVPDAQPDAPSRAIRTAQAMREIVATQNSELEGLTLPDVHIGAAAGEVLVTEITHGASWSVIGSSVNLASRLCDAAGAGEILVDDVCHALCAENNAWDPARTLSLKGQDTPTTAWPLCTSRDGSSERPISNLFVGRTAQIAALNAEMAAAEAANASRTVVIRGIGGIGKSSLVRHWLALHPEIEYWRVECDASRAQDDLQTLNDVLQGSTPATPEPAPRRRPLMDHPDPFPLVVHALRANLEKACGGQLHVLIVEDLQASDTVLGEFLRDLARQPLAQPLLVVATWRDDDTDVVTRPYLLGRTLALEGLNRTEAESLFEELAGEAIDSETLEFVIERTDGHPLMVCESAVHLRLLQSKTQRPDPSAIQAFRHSLPTSLRMFLAARIDRLDASLRAVLHDLSALGPRFSTEWVAAVLGRRAEDSLALLARQGILTGGPEWTFSHSLLREVAYETLTRAQRASLHRRQLRLLDSTADPHKRAEQALAWHQSVSPVDREQYSASVVAAVKESLALARQMYNRQIRAALEAVQRATSIARDCVRLDPALASQLWAVEAQCLAELGLFDDALRLAAQADRTADGADLAEHRLAPMMTKGMVLSNLRRFESARQTLDEAAVLAESIGDRSAQAEAIRVSADTWRHTLLSRFVTLTEEAFHLFEAAEDRRGAGECARTLAYLASVGPLPRYAKWRDLAGRLTDEADLRSNAALAKGDALAMGGRFHYPEYEAAGRVLLEAGEALEMPDLLSEGLLDLADARLHLGDASGAAEAATRLIQLATELSDRRMRAAAAAAAVRPFLRVGELRRSAEELRVAREMSTEFGLGEELFIASEEAVWLLDRGCWKDVERPLRASLEAMEKGGFPLAALSRRAEGIRIAAVTGAGYPQSAVRQLIADADELEAPPVASFVRTLDAWARASIGEAIDIPPPDHDACIEEIALRNDIAASALTDRVRREAAWKSAAETWSRLGYTVWLARAQARSGDVEAARHTLDVLDSPAEARAWALGDAG